MNCLLNLLRFDADVSLRGGCGTVLKEPLHQCYVKAVCVVDFRCVPLAEAVDTDPLVPLNFFLTVYKNCPKLSISAWRNCRKA